MATNKITLLLQQNFKSIVPERKPVKTKQVLTKWQEFSLFAWDPETKKFFGRNDIAWAKITAFYVAFYLICFGLFYFILWVYIANLTTERPKLILGSGLSYLMNPGLHTVPRGKRGGDLDTPLIVFNPDDSNTYGDHVKELKDVLQDYMMEREIPVSSPCFTSPPTQTRNCSIQGMSPLGPCGNISSNFGYDTGLPCILLRMNKVIGWEPQPYAAGKWSPHGVTPMDNGVTNVTSFTDPTSNVTMFGYDVSSGDSVMVTCQELTLSKTLPHPQPPLLHSVSFFPSSGLPVSCFPFCSLSQPGDTAAYLPPVIMARFNVTPSVAVSVWCRAWANNLDADLKDRTAGVIFQLAVNAG